MDKPSEQMLMAFADGALPPDEAIEVATFVTSDPQAQAFVDLMARTTKLARLAIADTAAGDVPPALVALVLDVAPSKPVQTSPIVQSWRATPRSATPTRYLSYALAASVAIVCAGVVSRGLWQSPDLLAVGPVPEGSHLAELLERSPSGALASIESSPLSSLHGAVVTTFFDGAKRPCREVEIYKDSEGTPSAAAIGCRTQTGRWEIAGVVGLQQASRSTNREAAYQPSGGAEADPMGKLIASIGATDALSEAEEADLRARGWHQGPN